MAAIERAQNQSFAQLDQFVYFTDYISHNSSETWFFIYNETRKEFIKYAVSLVRNHRFQITGVRHASFEADWSVDEEGFVTDIIPMWDTQTLSFSTQEQLEYHIFDEVEYFCRFIERDSFCSMLTFRSNPAACSVNCTRLECARSCMYDENCMYMILSDSGDCLHREARDECLTERFPRQGQTLYQCSYFGFNLFPVNRDTTTTTAPPEEESFIESLGMWHWLGFAGFCILLLYAFFRLYTHHVQDDIEVAKMQEKFTDFSLDRSIRPQPGTPKRKKSKTYGTKEGDGGGKGFFETYCMTASKSDV